MSGLKKLGGSTVTWLGALTTQTFIRLFVPYLTDGARGRVAGQPLQRSAPVREALTHLQAKALVDKYGIDSLHLVFQVEAAHGITATEGARQ